VVVLYYHVYSVVSFMVVISQDFRENCRINTVKQLARSSSILFCVVLCSKVVVSSVVLFEDDFLAGVV